MEEKENRVVVISSSALLSRLKTGCVMWKRESREGRKYGRATMLPAVETLNE